LITRATLGVALVVGVAVGFLVGRYLFIGAEPESALTPQWPGNRSPDREVFARVKEGLEAFRAQNPQIGPNDWSVREDPEAGLVETDWFHVHKGEVELKAQVVIWGSHYRVDVWSRALLGGRVRKTWWSRVTERRIQEEIERRRSVRAGEPTVPPGATLRAAPVNVGR
jgi:hypothetical protein